jgi:3-hydroxyisobutyrate dehydrogenase/2-hydroxy-3-oxopropionate reductase
MGSALARRLADAGIEVTLWNRTRARAEEVGVGRVADTPADAARDADIVITSLTGPDAVRETLVGPSGALDAAHGQLFVEMSTSGPDVVAELAPRVAETGSALIDAPLVGAPVAVLRGAAAVLVGGEPGDVERVRAVLSQFGEVRHVGPLGSGARLKLVNNSMLGAVITAAAEMQTAGEAIGLDGEDVFWVLARMVPGLEVRRAGFIDRRQEPTLFAVRDLRKDLDLGLDLYHRASSPAPVTALVRELVGEAAIDAADLDISAVITRYRTAPARDRVLTGSHA